MENALAIAAHTLGCKVNQCDTEALLAGLRRAGFATVGFDRAADVYIINTCTVTSAGDRKSRRMIRRARKRNPAAFVAVCGCMAQNKQAEINADFIFDARRPDDFFAKLKEIAGSKSSAAGSPPQEKNARTRAFVKIQDGCDRFCAYCIVPYVRGPVTSRPMAEILAEAKSHIENGALEIVLTGIQVASYGDDTIASLPALIKQAAALGGLRRLRLSSIDPWAVNGDFLGAVAESPILCDHFHLSLQSGCDATLAGMNRRYTTREYAAAAASLLELRPGAALTTDIIVGFPGESDLDFQKSLDFVRRMRFARVHVFEFSPRAGTPAAELPQVPSAVKSARGKAMRQLAADLRRDFLDAQIGKTFSVLFESAKSGRYIGHSSNYCPVEARHGTNPVNTIREARITGRTGEALTGEI